MKKIFNLLEFGLFCRLDKPKCANRRLESQSILYFVYEELIIFLTLDLLICLFLVHTIEMATQDYQFIVVDTASDIVELEINKILFDAAASIRECENFLSCLSNSKQGLLGLSKIKECFSYFLEHEVIITNLKNNQVFLYQAYISNIVDTNTYLLYDKYIRQLLEYKLLLNSSMINCFMESTIAHINQIENYKEYLMKANEIMVKQQLELSVFTLLIFYCGYFMQYNMLFPLIPTLELMIVAGVVSGYQQYELYSQFLQT